MPTGIPRRGSFERLAALSAQLHVSLQPHPPLLPGIIGTEALLEKQLPFMLFRKRLSFIFMPGFIPQSWEQFPERWFILFISFLISALPFHCPAQPEISVSAVPRRSAAAGTVSHRKTIFSTDGITFRVNSYICKITGEVQRFFY